MPVPQASAVGVAVGVATAGIGGFRQGRGDARSGAARGCASQTAERCCQAIERMPKYSGNFESFKPISASTIANGSTRPTTVNLGYARIDRRIGAER